MSIKCRPSSFLGLFRHYGITYLIEDRNVYIKKSPWYRSKFIEPDSMTFDDLSAVPMNGEGIAGFFKFLVGIRDVKISNSSRSIIWKDVWCAGKVAEMIKNKEYETIRQNTQHEEASQSSSASQEGLTDAPRPQDKETSKIPDHIEFSDQVICLPRPPTILGYYQFCMWYRDHLQFRWVNKGDTLGFYRITTALPKLFGLIEEKYLDIEIKSPVSGLILTRENKADLGLADEMKDHHHDGLVILLPKDEIPSFPADQLYRQAYQKLMSYIAVPLSDGNPSYFTSLFLNHLNKVDNVEKAIEWLDEAYEEDNLEYKYFDVTKDKWSRGLHPISFIEKAKEMKPEYLNKLEKFDCPKIRLHLGEIAFEKDDFALAIECYEYAWPHYRDEIKYSEALYQEGLSCKYDEKRSLKYFKRAVEINPAHEDACKELGIEPKNKSRENNYSNNDWKTQNSGKKSDDFEDARIRWELPKRYSLKILNDRYDELDENNKFSKKQLDRDYFMLKNKVA